METNVRSILGLHIGIMEKKMETTIVFLDGKQSYLQVSKEL